MLSCTLTSHTCTKTHLFRVDVQRTQDEDDTAEGGVRGHSAQPVIIQVKQHHLVLCGLEDEVAKLLQLDGRCV